MGANRTEWCRGNCKIRRRAQFMHGTCNGWDLTQGDSLISGDLCLSRRSSVSRARFQVIIAHTDICSFCDIGTNRMQGTWTTAGRACSRSLSMSNCNLLCGVKTRSLVAGEDDREPTKSRTPPHRWSMYLKSHCIRSSHSSHC